MASLVTSPKAKPCSRHCSRVMSGKRSCSACGRMTAPDRLWPPHVLAFSMTATGTSPRRSIVSGSSPRSWSSRLAVASPAVPPPTIATPTSMRSSSASSSRLMNSFCESTGGGYAAGTTRPLLDPAIRDQPPFLALRASVSLGTILLRSPTMPRSENSKIGALASLLIATMFSEDCMPTLCWMAPEMPAARYSFGATVLPVWPIWAAEANQPASTTARAAAPGGGGGGEGAAERRGDAFELPQALGLAEPPATGHEVVGVLDVDVGA